MRKSRRHQLAWLSLAIAVVACATYETPSGPRNSGEAGSDNSGGKSAGGAVTTSGSASIAGKSNTAAGTGGNSSGGTAPSDAGSADGGDPGVVSMGGKAGSGGSASGGTAGSAGSSGSGSGGQLGEGGAGGAPASCTTNEPDATCSCQVYSGHEYWFCTTYLTFAAAEAKCTAASMHLPKIETQAEDSWLFDSCLDLTMGEYFLGGTDATTPDAWSWLQGGKFWDGVANGTATGYTHWGAAEPNASGDCVVVQGNFVWDDRICTDQRKYVCEAIP